MKLILILLFTALTLPVIALEDTRANREEQADRYLKATPPKEIIDDTAEQMAKTIPEDRREDFKALLIKHLDVVPLAKVMKEAMVKHFTADELKALADFYGSALGKSAMKKYGAFMANVMPTLQAELVKAMDAKTKEEKK